MRVLLLLLLLPLAGLSQQADSVRQADVLRFADASIYSLSSPARWRGKQWATLGALVSITAAVSLADNPVRSFWKGKNNKMLDGIHTVGYHYGKAYTAMGMTGGLYLAGLVFKDQWTRETALILGSSVFSVVLLESTLKPFAGRARPVSGDDHYTFTFFNRAPVYHSFPSGHASIACTISTVMARRVKSIPLKIVFYSLAGTTMVCRLYSDAHWISDLAFGSALAWFCADVAIKRIEENRFRKRNRVKWKASPFPSGITLRAVF